MSIVWNTKAHFYDELVTETKNKMLRGFLGIEEKMLDSLLIDLTKNKTVNKPISLIEIGSGTGRTLFSYIMKQEIWKHLAYLIGIDNAGAMREISVSKLNEIKKSFLLHQIKRREIERKYLFLLMDVLDMNNYFKNGQVNLEMLIQRYGKNEFIRKLKPLEYTNSMKIICCLLNTLGVIVRPTEIQKAAEVRQTAINNMVNAAGEGGKIIISVFSAGSFASKAPRLYKSIMKLAGEFNATAFNEKTFEFATETYYSHWFTKEEVIDMMKASGCKDVKDKDIAGELKGRFLIGDT